MHTTFPAAGRTGAAGTYSGGRTVGDVQWGIGFVIPGSRDGKSREIRLTENPGIRDLFPGFPGKRDSSLISLEVYLFSSLGEFILHYLNSMRNCIQILRTL